MSLNLIEDAWIPVLCADGSRRVIAPWQMAEVGILRPDWPRADLNIACYELLIGLVYLADPPADLSDWRARRVPDPDRLRGRLAACASAFNLLGCGPRFLQDLEPLVGDPNPVDMLFIDSAGANAARNNADVMVHRARYDALDLPLAAMALFTFQAHAPAGGAGNRTSMRGGGPMVTLLDPQDGLWALVWGNVPYGAPATVADLPWMRATRVSDKGAETLPPDDKVFGVEAFFGMPRRLRLVEAGGRISGVVQKPWGTNYALWKHPLAPHYRLKAGSEWLPVHPRAGRFSYRNWLGIVACGATSDLREQALCIRTGEGRGVEASILVAGWAMDNMKPRDFILSVQPLVRLSSVDQVRLAGLIAAAEAAGVALRSALEPVLAKGEAREAEREAFFATTEGAFRQRLAQLQAGSMVETAWLGDLRRQAVAQFDAVSLPGLDQRETDAIGKIVRARRYLTGCFEGYGVQGKELFVALGLDLPVGKKGKAA